MVDREQVLKVARLARLRLAEAEIEDVAGQLSRILDHVQQLRELDAVPAPPEDETPGGSAALRPDEARPSLPRDEVLARAPKTDGETFLVPPVIEGAEE